MKIGSAVIEMLGTARRTDTKKKTGTFLQFSLRRKNLV